MTIFLKPEQKQFIQTQIETGKYINAEQVVEEAFQLLEKRDRALDELRHKIAVGTKQITSEQVTDGEIVFSRLQQKIQEMIESGL
jgi:antitoxin ParD1/3/4